MLTWLYMFWDGLGGTVTTASPAAVARLPRRHDTAVLPARANAVPMPDRANTAVFPCRGAE